MENNHKAPDKDTMLDILDRVETKMQEQGKEEIVSILKLVISQVKEIEIQAKKSNLFEDEIAYNPHKTEKYKYNWKMLKPALETMTNRAAIQNGFTDSRTKNYTVTDSDIEDVERNKTNEWCDTFQIKNADGQTLIQEVPFDQITLGKEISVTADYKGEGYSHKGSISLSETEKSFFQQHGRTIHDPKRDLTSYDGEGNYVVEEYLFNEERKSIYNTIWWWDEDYQRYPYNTVFVTTDILLHTYFKVLESNLKYYEQATARKIVSNISTKYFNHFINKAKTTSDPELKKYYEFLVAYRAIPSSILMDEHTLYGLNFEGDITDEQIQQKVRAQLQNKLTQVNSIYHEDLTNTLDEIFKWTTSKGEYYLFQKFGEEFNVTSDLELKQDYTQFVPRSHYRTNALLKTYFVWMKYLMRNKFFYQDIKHTKASLILVNNMQEQKNYNELYDFVKEVVWSDDDINIYDVQSFLKDKGLNTDKDILTKLNDKDRKQLQESKPQLIMGTTYETDNFANNTEESAKFASVGFIFFWEKFTLDSWLFDSLTAGSAEQETTFKPPVATALSIPAVLADNSLAQELVQTRLNTKQTQNRLNADQNEWYQKVSKEMKDLIYKYDFGQNIYHSRLDMLNYLFVKKDENNPYFMQDPQYTYKNLNSYMGSYTELKHATLLYVKQAYAELWGWASDCPSISITPPALPVPKGYIEPNIELMDQLKLLAKKTQTYFPEDDKLPEFINFINFVREIAIKQSRNKVISDEEFEKLRLYDETLGKILTPKPYIWQLLQKEERASLIADIFNSGEQGPLYEAIGRPQLILIMIDDVNGKRIVLWPVYTHYEFYNTENPGIDSAQGRFVDHERQNAYDNLTDEKKKEIETVVKYIE